MAANRGNWRVIVAGLLLAGSLWVLVLGRMAERGGRAPEWHVNTNAAFEIRPPPGWSRRTDDRDGTQIAPASQPTRGFASLIVSMRLSSDQDAVGHLAQAAARAPAGPVRDLRWIRQERVMMDDGGRGAIGEFTQTYRGAPVHGWMLITVREGRLMQAVATVPESSAGEWGAELVASLKSLQPL